jgi:hypothetical protein
MTLDDGTPGLRLKLGIAVLAAAVLLLALAHACGLRDARPAPVHAAPADAPPAR